MTLLLDINNHTTSTCTGSVVEQRITYLRQFIIERPKNGRAIAELACLLHMMNTNTISSNSNSNLTSNLDEALRLANLSIQVAPTKPYGYVALSKISFNHTIRMQALTNAVEYCDININTVCDNNYNIALLLVHHQLNLSRIDLAIRLLIEPRHEEKNQYYKNNLSTKMNTSSNTVSNNSSTRSLSTNEEELYQRIKNYIEDTITNIEEKTTTATTATTATTTSCICLKEYHLGLFFRKMEPYTIYRQRSIYWFQNCIQHYNTSSIVIVDNNNNNTKNISNSVIETIKYDDQNKIHQSNNKIKHCYVMAKFWLATLQEEQHNLNTTTGSTATTGNWNNNNSSSQLVPISKCPPEYIIGLYSTFANRFDTLLVTTLQYRTPTLLCQLVNECFSLSTRQQQQHQSQQQKNVKITNNDLINILQQVVSQQSNVTSIITDLGCGTGLSGIAFQECVIYHEYKKMIQNYYNKNSSHNSSNCKDTLDDIDVTGIKTKTMIGVDLSPEMIQKAIERKCYDTVYVGDVTTILSPIIQQPQRRKQQQVQYQETSSADNEDINEDTIVVSRNTTNTKHESSLTSVCSYNSTNNKNDHVVDVEIQSVSNYSKVYQYCLVCACDVFVYIGNLQEIFLRVYRSLVPCGIFAFSTELLSSNKQSTTTTTSSLDVNIEPMSYCLQSCARFAHSEHYIRTLSLECGYIILKLKQCTIRKNLGIDVIGLLVVVQKPTTEK